MPEQHRNHLQALMIRIENAHSAEECARAQSQNFLFSILGRVPGMDIQPQPWILILNLKRNIQLKLPVNNQ